MARPRSEAARQKMLGATVEIAFEHGVNAVTFDEVARRSGVAKTTIYRHFDTKNQLVMEALDGATVFPAIPDTGTLRTDLLDFFTTIQPMFRNERLRALGFEFETERGVEALLERLLASRPNR